MALRIRAASALTMLLAASQLPQHTSALNNGVGLTPALGWSTWNHFAANVNASLLMEIADAFVSSGLRGAGYTYINLDDGWADHRLPNGTIVANPTKFPDGLQPVIAYIHSRGLKFGIYTSYTGLTCQGLPGSNGYEAIDAATYAAWGVDYLKEDDCGGASDVPAWQSYGKMRDALNATGRPIYFSICQFLPYVGPYPEMHCAGGGTAYTVFPWLAAGQNPQTVANSILIEYCNNFDYWGGTDGIPQTGGMLSNLDSQQLLTFDNVTAVGAFNDNDMLTVCNGGQSTAEYRAQFSAWSILTSPLILGNDPRSMDADCLSIVLNTEVIAVNQDPLVSRGALVYSWPGRYVPAADAKRPAQSSAGSHSAHAVPTPTPTYAVELAPCNDTDAMQLFVFNATTGFISVPSVIDSCLTFGGDTESNVYLAGCEGWVLPSVGGQLWAPNTSATGDTTLFVVGNVPYALSVDKSAAAPACGSAPAGTVQVCSQPRGDCGPCGPATSLWTADFSANPQGALVRSTADGGEQCLAVGPAPPPPRVDIQLQVWTKPLADGSVAALALNRSPGPLAVNITWSMLGWGASPNRRASVRDLWAHADEGVWAGAYGATVRPHDVVMLRVIPEPAATG